MSIFYSGGPKSLVLSHHSVIVPFCVVPTFPMENLRRKQITQLVGGGLHFLPSLTYSTGRLRIQVLPRRCQHLGLLQSRVMWGKRQGGRVHGIHFAGGQRGVILALVSSFGAAGTQAGAEAPPRASPAVLSWHLFPETSLQSLTSTLSMIC